MLAFSTACYPLAARKRKEAAMLKLYSYFRSSAAYRCRIALNLKGVPHEMAYVHLLKDGGQHNAPSYLALNPQGMVPTLEHDGRIFTQSLAIIEYLEEAHPEPPLLPGNAEQRARIRAFALAIACDIHPIANLRVLKYLKGPMQQPQEAIDTWYRHWVETGLKACEVLLSGRQSRFCFGDAPTMADVCLVPQMFNARRTNCDLSLMPRLVAIDAACRELPAFARAAPEAQADAA
jgi:maleylpyruvate isomerase